MSSDSQLFPDPDWFELADEGWSEEEFSLPSELFWSDRPVIGYCSKCGEAREGDYTCRSGGKTVPKKP